MSGDTKDETKVQSWEEIVQAIGNIMDTNLSEDKLVTLENLVQHYRKVKSPSQHRQNQRKVPPRIISGEWRERAEESKNLLTTKLQLRDPCLLSMAIFPENSIIKKRSLVYWWIGEDLVSQGGDKTAELVGEEVYSKLLHQGLIGPNDSDPSPLMNRCKMHPLIRYRLISEAEEAGLFYFESKDKTSHEDLKNLSSSRVRLIVGGEDKISTVINVNQEYLNLPHHWLSNVRKLKVLQLGRWQHSPRHHIEVDDQKFLDELGVHHKHLKFLSLRGISRITSLPNSIVQLVNLEILDLRACHNLEKLPEDIASLKKLRACLATCQTCYLIERMPKGNEKLSSLQVLKGFVIGTVRKNPCRISDLRKLTKLRRLSIYIGHGAARWEEQFESLKEVASLHSLTISWGVTSQERREINSFLPLQLEKLELIGIPVESIPKWLNPRELKHLKKLYIIGGKLKSWDHQEQNEQWSVEILRLKHLQNLSIGNKEDVLKKFPRLGYFEKIICADDDVLWYKSRAV
ncbi:hypothetical protein ACJRO7_004101 [Eucalyptus globulus]|uniref:Disease resistance RPP13-like protein 4 n=1 Tax=Eucalyptus globulus TaxID=34317 RepID=A0ABD3IY27_EUCGL